jgi:hypothetical protein
MCADIPQICQLRAQSSAILAAAPICFKLDETSSATSAAVVNRMALQLPALLSSGEPLLLLFGLLDRSAASFRDERYPQPRDH